MPRATPIQKIKGMSEHAELQELLRKLYPRFPSKVARIIVPAVDAPSSEHGPAMAMYKQAFKKNESLHHSYLKWFGLHWSMRVNAGKAFSDYRYEARIAYPDRLVSALAEDGNFEIAGQGVVLPPGQLYVTFDCQIKVADVYSEDSIVECGDTDPSSLVLPLASRIAKHVLWLPHQHKDLHSKWPTSSEQCVAFLIERQSGICETANQSNLYAMQTVTRGEQLYFLGDPNAVQDTT